MKKIAIAIIGAACILAGTYVHIHSENSALGAILYLWASGCCISVIYGKD